MYFYYLLFFIVFENKVNPSSAVCIFFYFYDHSTYFHLFGNDEMSAFEGEYKSVGLRDKNKSSIL